MSSYTPEKDLHTLEVFADALPSYLREKELYGEVGRLWPRLTPGAVLLRLHRLQALVLPPRQAERLQRAARACAATRQTWAHHYSEKLGREWKARLKTYADFLEDHKDNFDSMRAAYPAEALHRTYLHHVARELEAFHLWDEAHEQALFVLDQVLKASFDQDHPRFIWPEVLAEVYPPDLFWWLYGEPSEKQAK
jgi:hypothetical protein